MTSLSPEEVKMAELGNIVTYKTIMGTALTKEERDFAEWMEKFNVE